MAGEADRRTVAPCGTWPSPLSAADLASASASYADLVVDGAAVLWLQSDPDKGGRYAVMRHTPAGGTQQLTPDGFNARTRVHEYGGGALGAGSGVVLATSWVDQRVYQVGEDELVPVTREPATPAGIRWAAMAVLPGAPAFIAVRETHGLDRPRPNVNIHGHEEAVNELVRVDLASGDEQVLVTGPDFVGGPWVSPGGRQMAWLQWDHPHMPWDTAELWVGVLGPEGLSQPQRIAGGDSAVCDAHWVDDETLWYSDDRSGWWNTYAWSAAGGRRRLQDEAIDSGFPRWVHGGGRLADADGVPFVASADRGLTQLRRLTDGDASNVIEVDGVAAISQLRPQHTQLVAIAGGPALPTAVWRIDPQTGQRTALSTLTDDPAARIGAIPQPISFPTADGATAHALYYPPTSATHEGPQGEQPPLVVMTHGGPTGAAQTTLNGRAQYWASRGFAVVDVNYRGSVGYGRAFRDALKGNWGIHDVTDTIAAANHLVGEQLADPSRLIIEGGSAGGYTTLLALATTDTFAAGGSLFGVADLTALASDTHKFESRYLDSMIGPWPEEREVYVERSPISHVDELSTPLIVLQGDEDAVVPPAQAEQIVAALRERNLPHAYLLFEGEQHGFRKAANIARAYEARLAFYGLVLGFDPADDIDLPEYVAP